MTSTADAFGRLVAATGSAMAVVTAAAGDRRDGCLVGFHGQCGIEPPLYAVWLSVANFTYTVALDATHLVVHLVGDGDRALAELFGATTEDRHDKLAACAWHEGPHGTVLLDDARVLFIGRRRNTVGVAGDHVCFIVEPTVVVPPPHAYEPMRLPEVADLSPGHAATDRRTAAGRR